MTATRRRALTALIATVVSGGCAGDTTAPRGPILLTAAPGARLAQVAPPGGAATAAPAVLVEIEGAPVVGVNVKFDVTLGGGTVSETIVKTDARGIASCGAWTLGAEGANEVVATVEGGPSLAFGGWAIDLPTESDAYDLIGANGAPLPTTVGPPPMNPYEVVAGRMVLHPDSTYDDVIVQYQPTERAFVVSHYHGSYARSGSQLTLTGYAGAPTATGALQIDLLVVHVTFEWFWGDDTYAPPEDDVYRRRAYPNQGNLDVKA
jgi:hypothetical protein